MLNLSSFLRHLHGHCLNRPFPDRRIPALQFCFDDDVGTADLVVMVMVLAVEVGREGERKIPYVNLEVRAVY